MRHMRERMLTLCCELAGGVLHNNTLLYKYFFNEKKRPLENGSLEIHREGSTFSKAKFSMIWNDNFNDLDSFQP